MNTTTDLAQHSTITQLVGVYQQAEADIRAALASITNAQEQLNHFFDGRGYGFSIARSSYDLPEPDDAIARLHKATWRAIVERLELRKMLSLARIKDLDRQLETGTDLPPITFENILAMLESNLQNADAYLEEKVREIYEWLRPDGYALREYKTNQESQRHGIGRKVILTWNTVRANYSGRGYQVNYDRHDHLRALDQVFHMLDGKPAFQTSYRGELCDAIETQTREGGNLFETDYFRGRCFQNGNLHLELKRADLVERFNLVAGGMRLQDTNPQPKATPATNHAKPTPTPKPEPTASPEDQISALMQNWQTLCTA